ncbi:MAG TPA: SgcJ/EcaC family oxidoreductase [Polyangiaceae bacterium]|nr:SgcJ/EcaC family oxidoreductase [Polyangiaceae bacterium]
MSEDERAIRNIIATWMTATQAGDQQKVLSLMADDVIFMVPGKEPFGKEAFAASVRDMKDVHIEGKSRVEEVVVAGEWAWCRTHLELTATPPSGRVMRRSGYTLSILRKKPDGNWVLARDANLLTSE